MASIDPVSGTKFIGNPIVVPVTPGGVPAKATFHKVRLEVITGGQTFTFSSLVNGLPVVNFDVSSALRAISDIDTPTAMGTNSYPSYSFTMNAYDDYLEEGIEQKGKNAVTGSVGGSFYRGALTDRERLAGILSPSSFSRKPFSSSPEVVHIGKTWVAGGTGSSPSAQVVDITASTAATTQYYPIAAPRDSYELRFINSLGVHESLHVQCLIGGETNITTDRHVIARQETVTQFSRGVSIKQNDHERWKMSSGPLDRAWQQYYLHEPLMARWAWLKVDGQWLPVHILPDETVPGIDRQKASLLEVPFTIEFDINGSPFA